MVVLWPTHFCLSLWPYWLTAVPPLLADNPAVLPVKSNVSLLENTSLHLAVYSSGHPIEDVRHKWRLNGVPIDIANLSTDKREATIPSVQFQGDVEYSCEAQLFIGSFVFKEYAYFLVTVYGECRPENTVRDSYVWYCVSYVCTTSGVHMWYKTVDFFWLIECADNIYMSTELDISTWECF